MFRILVFQLTCFHTPIFQSSHSFQHVFSGSCLHELTLLFLHCFIHSIGHLLFFSFVRLHSFRSIIRSDWLFSFHPFSCFRSSLLHPSTTHATHHYNTLHYTIPPIRAFPRQSAGVRPGGSPISLRRTRPPKLDLTRSSTTPPLSALDGFADLWSESPFCRSCLPRRLA